MKVFHKQTVSTYVGSVLVLAEKRQVEEDGQRGGVGGEDDDLRDTSVEGLGGLVGTLLQLAVVAGLLHEVEDLLGESLVGDGPCGGLGGHVVGIGGCWSWKGYMTKLAQIIRTGSRPWDRLEWSKSQKIKRKAGEVHFSELCDAERALVHARAALAGPRRRALFGHAKRQAAPASRHDNSQLSPSPL